VTTRTPPPAANLLGLQGLSGAEVLALLDEAAEMKARLAKEPRGLTDLAGRTCCLLFFEPSTRTMNSFAAAARALSAEVVFFTAGPTSSTVKGETLLDTATNLEAIGADVFVVRHKSSGAPHLLARRLAGMRRGVPAPGIVNAGDGQHEHPTQALLDMLTLRERFGALKGLEVAIVGDILHSRVARSNAWGLSACGAHVTFVSPPAWIPVGAEALGAGGSGCGRITVSHRLDEVMPRADAIMALRIQKERLGGDPGPSGNAYAAEFGITEERLARAKDTCVIMHPGPINRGVEISSAVADGPRSVILAQVANGVYVRMAALARCTRAIDGAGARR
jgi:aspartate carbamoyltransferase catalytic subunit